MPTISPADVGSVAGLIDPVWSPEDAIQQRLPEYLRLRPRPSYKLGDTDHLTRERRERSRASWPGFYPKHAI